MIKKLVLLALFCIHMHGMKITQPLEQKILNVLTQLYQQKKITQQYFNIGNQNIAMLCAYAIEQKKESCFDMFNTSHCSKNSTMQHEDVTTLTEFFKNCLYPLITYQLKEDVEALSFSPPESFALRSSKQHPEQKKDDDIIGSEITKNNVSQKLESAALSIKKHSKSDSFEYFGMCCNSPSAGLEIYFNYYENIALHNSTENIDEKE
jgi:hypothetical protein